MVSTTILGAAQTIDNPNESHILDNLRIKYLSVIGKRSMRLLLPPPVIPTEEKPLTVMNHTRPWN